MATEVETALSSALPEELCAAPRSACETASWDLRRSLRYALGGAAVAGAVAGLEFIRSRFQQRQMFVPSRYPTGIWEPSTYGLPYRDIWFESEDGVALHGWWIEHEKARATVVYCHGNAGSIADRLAIYLELRRLKINIFTFDYRGYGRSAGRPTEDGVCADVRAAVDYVTGELGKAPSRTLLFGHSMGGAVAIDGALHRPVAGLVVQSSFTDVRSMAHHFHPSSPVRWLARNAFRSIEKVPRLALPKLFIHGTADGTVPFSMGEQLFAAAVEPKQWLAVPQAGHNDVHRHRPLRYYRAIGRFYRGCL